MAKSLYYSFRGPGFRFQHPLGGSKLPIAPVPSVSQGLLNTCCAHAYNQTHTYTKFFNNNNNPSTWFKIALSITSIKAQASGSSEASILQPLPIKIVPLLGSVSVIRAQCSIFSLPAPEFSLQVTLPSARLPQTNKPHLIPAWNLVCYLKHFNIKPHHRQAPITKVTRRMGNGQFSVLKKF